MSFYSITTPEMKRSGTMNIQMNYSVTSPYSFLGKDNVALFQSDVPFSLLFTEYDPDAEQPFRINILSPDFSMYTSLSQEEFEYAVKNRPLHQHNTYELICVLSGEMYQRIENTRHRYPEGSCCLINRAVRHTEEYETGFHSVTLSLSRDFLITILCEGEVSYFRAEKSHTRTDLMTFLQSEFAKEGSAEKKYIDFNSLPGVSVKEEMSALFSQISYRIKTPGPGTSLIIRALTYHIFNLLNNNDLFETEPMKIGTTSESRLFAVITELMEETDGRISRSELAERLAYSGNYLNRIVQKYSGMNIFDYGCSFTMNKAVSLLTGTDQSISEIVERLGFSDRTHFYRLFKKEFGMTPRQYRIRYMDQTPKAEADI